MSGAISSAPVPTRAIAALSFTAFASAASMRVADSLLPSFNAEFGTGPAQAAQAVTAFAIAYGLFQIPLGAAGDRFGKYRLIAWAALASAASALACALMPDFDALVIARFVAGATVAAIIPLAMAWIGDVVPYDRRQTVLARFLTGQILGLSGGQVLGGIAADYFGWRMPFLFLAAWYVIAGFMLLGIQRQLPAQKVTARAPNANLARGIAGEMREVLAQRWARGMSGPDPAEPSGIPGTDPAAHVRRRGLQSGMKVARCLRAVPQPVLRRRQRSLESQASRASSRQRFWSMG